uniref:Suppressor protein SRP40 n=2 Tax=Lygus hesperus TaxID=30085 RepID=A0A0A9Y8I0_LYGHE
MSILDTLVYHYLNESGYKKAAKELKRQGCSTEPVDITLEDVVESYNEGKKLKQLITLLATSASKDDTGSEDDTSGSSESEEEQVYIVDEDDDNGDKDNDVQLIEYVTDYPTEDVEITSESSASSDSEIEDDASEESDSSSSSTSDDEPVYQTVKRRKTRNYPEPSYTDPSDSSSSGSDGDEICVSADDSESSTTVSEDESSDGASSDTSNSSSSSSSSSSEDGSDSECDGCKHRSKMYTLESSPKKHHHHNTPFQRVKASEMDDLHPLMRDLSYKKQKELGATTGYGEAAHKNMFQTRGKSFNKLKQKYKNSYRGGRIDPSAVHSHKLL